MSSLVLPFSIDVDAPRIDLRSCILKILKNRDTKKVLLRQLFVYTPGISVMHARKPERLPRMDLASSSHRQINICKIHARRRSQIQKERRKPLRRNGADRARWADVTGPRGSSCCSRLGRYRGMGSRRILGSGAGGGCAASWPVGA